MVKQVSKSFTSPVIYCNHMGPVPWSAMVLPHSLQPTASMRGVARGIMGCPGIQRVEHSRRDLLFKVLPGQEPVTASAENSQFHMFNGGFMGKSSNIGNVP